MTELGVNVCTVITFGNVSYEIPEALYINPQGILDETDNLYRISIDDMHTNKDLLFSALDKHIPFIESMHVETNGDKLTFTLAHITKVIKPYGTFYDIEAMADDTQFKERNTCN